MTGLNELRTVTPSRKLPIHLFNRKDKGSLKLMFDCQMREQKPQGKGEKWPFFGCFQA
ncbi:hypothetical protein JHK87_009541 [Glycine soja]|nr:hypothetical protein JHK87_009541 [Glycine soja]